MEFLKGRTLEYGEKVFVYFNLHKYCFSVKSKRTGLVVAHTNRIDLENATFKVSEAGRQRVLREQKKNVHAGVEGQWFGASLKSPESYPKQATYNPYKFSSFVEVQTLEPLKTAKQVRLDSKKVYFK